MKIFGNERFRIYIREDDHPPPHCHVRFGDESEICIMIPLIEPMYGATISRDVYDAIENNLDLLTETWDKFHPKRHKELRMKNIKQSIKNDIK
jgi:hypothetical protein